MQVLEKRAHLRAQHAIVPPNSRSRILQPKVAIEIRIAVADHHAAHAARGRSQEQTSQRRFDDREIDFDAGGTLAIRRRRHPQRRPRALVEAAARPVARIVEGRRHGGASFQGRLDLSDPAGVGVGARRDPDDLRERPLKVEAAQPDAAGQGAEGVALFRIRPDDVARLLNLFNLCCHTQHDKRPVRANLSEDCSVSP